ELVGNMPTENLIQFFEANGVKHGLDMNHFGKSMKKANSIFG
ncbi:MAG: hypothetical protein ACI9SG_003018, partial [Maribacter sp.]